jgi:nucleotide-binding universal stress UspA family protein
MRTHYSTPGLGAAKAELETADLSRVRWNELHALGAEDGSELSPAGCRRLDVRRILVPIDLSGTSKPLLEWAHRIAEALGAELTLLYVYPQSWLQGGSQDGAEAGQSSELATEAAQRLATLYREVTSRNQRARTRFATGNPAREILRTAEAIAADLIILSWHGQEGFRRWLHSQVTAQVIQRAPCDVLALPETLLRKGSPAGRASPVRWKTIMAAADFTECARNPVRHAASWAADFGARLALVHVVRMSLLGSRASLSNPRKVRKTARESAEQRLAAWFQTEVPVSVPIRPMVLAGMSVRSRLAQAVQRVNPDLVVVQSPRRSWWPRFSEEAEAHRILSRALCPVLHRTFTANEDGAEPRTVNRSGHPRSKRVVRVQVAGRRQSMAVENLRHVLAAVELPLRDPTVLQQAFALLRPGGRLRLLHVAHPDALPDGEYRQGLKSRQAEEMHARHIRHCTRQLQKLVVQTLGAGVACDVEVAEERQVARGIAQAAERFAADVVCLGSPPPYGLRALVFGSTFREVLRFSRTPVLLSSAESTAASTSLRAARLSPAR